MRPCESIVQMSEYFIKSRVMEEFLAMVHEK